MKRVAALGPSGAQVDGGTGEVMPGKSEYRG